MRAGTIISLATEYEAVAKQLEEASPTARLTGCGKTPERLLFPEFLAADTG